MEFLGILKGFYETGTEGTVWILHKDGCEGYAAIEVINQDDHLIIYDNNNQVVFDGIIKKDTHIGWQPYPFNPGYGQPAALNHWIHWTQSGFQPDDWAKFFIGDSKYRAKLIREKDAKGS